MTNNRYFDFYNMLVSIAEYTRSFSHMPDFNILPADHSRGGSFGFSSFAYTAWYKFNTDSNEEVATYWEISVTDANKSSVAKYFLKNKSTAEIIELIREDPQKFLDELTVFMVHES